jgi:hypothetical protein
MRLPQPVYYKAFYQAGETRLVVHGDSRFGAPYLPPPLQQELDHRGIKHYDYAWVVSDVSSLAQAYGLVLNLSHHAWYFQEDILAEVISGRRVEVPTHMGTYTFNGSGVVPFPDRVCLPFQTLDALPMTVHPQKGKGSQFGGLCCSPNNARFAISPGGSDVPIAHLWTVAVVGEGADARAIVTLQWVVYQHMPILSSLLSGCGTLFEVIQRAVEAFGESSPVVKSVGGMFGYGAEKGFGASGYGIVTETPPLHHVKPQKKEGEGRGQARRGRGDRREDGGRRSTGGRGGREGGERVLGYREGEGETAESGPSGSLMCSQCHVSRPRESFTNSQAKREEGRRCKRCVEERERELQTPIGGGGVVRTPEPVRRPGGGAGPSSGGRRW